MRILTSEQPRSAANMLQEAGVQHGDTTRVQMAVGVPDETEDNLAFCPGTAKVVQVLKRGTPADHAAPIAGEIVFTNPEEVLKALDGRRGMVTLTADVHCNGNMAFTAVPGTVRFHEVPCGQIPHLRRPSGKPIAESLLQLV